MKKIIYSLVIMIAAGSLFTSCIEQVEPLGIQDMRFAKAEYIRALKDLRAADAELVRAEAAHELARARYVDAMTANLNADTEYQKLLNEYQQLINEARQDTNDVISQETANRIDSIKKRMELRELEHAKKMADAEQAYALAKDSLRVALRNIALYAQSLTADEQAALASAVYMYETAFEVTAAQQVKVLKAQYKLDSLVAAAAVGDTVYDKSSAAYIGQVEKWNKDIENSRAAQAILAALLIAVPDSLVYDDVDGWKEQVDKLIADSTAADYQRYQTKVEMSQYYVANIHDGVKAFNDAVTLFKAENWKNDGTVEPTFSSADSAILAKGEPKQSDYTMGFADTIDMPALKVGTTDAYTWFKSMIDGYFNPLTNAAPGASGNYQIGGEDVKMMRVDGGYWKLYANQAWKDFILGTDMGTIDSQNYVEKDDDGNVVVDVTTDYGLNGAISVLERKRVWKEEEGLNYADSLTKYKDAWKADRETLTTVNNAYFAVAKANRKAIGDVKDSLYMKSYEPYKLALQTLNEKKAALNTKTGDSATVAGKMVTAIDNFITLYNDHINGGTWSTADSTQMLSAAVEFAKAREAYFTAANGLKTDTLNFIVENKHPNYLHYLKAGNPKTMDSIEFTKLTMKELRETATMINWEGHTETFCKYGWFWNDATAPAGADTANTIFSQIFQQMFGGEMVAILDAGNNLTDTAVFNNMTGGDEKYLAFYKEFQYDKAKKNFKKANGDPMPTVADTERKAVENAEKALNAAREKYKAVYMKYWGTDGYVSGNDPKNEVKATSYTDSTFTEPFPIVNFNVGATAVDTTTGLAVVLASIDAQTTPRKVLGDNATTHSDFWHYMKWLSLSGTIDEDSLNEIKDWVSAVGHAFALDAEASSMPDTVKFKEAKEAYDLAKENKDFYDAYILAKKAFTGEDEDGNPNEIVELSDPAKPIGTEFKVIDDVLIDKLVETNVLGTYTGEWAEDLGGKQLELAKTLFPDYPEKIAEWNAEIEYVTDLLEEYGILIQAAKKAYTAAAVVAGENVGADNWDDLVENYKQANEAYRNRIIEKIETLQGQIEQWQQNLAKWKVGAPAREIEIAEAANTLKIETARLQGFEQALAYAKANLDHILEYIKSLDVNFVVPAVDFDED